MTGKFGIHNGVVGHGGTAGDVRHEGERRQFQDTLAKESLPAFLRSAGLKTVLVSPFAERHSSWTFYAGFNEIHNTGKCGMESAEEVTPAVLNWIEHNARKDNWFLYVNYWDPHTPYRAPEDFGNPFAGDPLPAWIAASLLKGQEAGRDYLVVSQCAHVCQRSVRFGSWLYVRTYHDGYHLFDQEMLFDLDSDPYEQTNLAAEHRQVCRDAVYYLNEWHDHMMETMPFDTDLLWTVMKEGGPYHAKGFLPKYAQWLEQTGRGHAITELKRRHPAEFGHGRPKG